MNTSTRSAEIPAIHSLNCFGFTVPDLEEAHRFYEAFGLDVRRERSRIDLYARGNQHRWATIQEERAHAKKLQFISFGCYPDDFHELCAYCERRGFSSAPPHPQAAAGGSWFLHPDGIPIQVLIADKTAPDYEFAPSVVPARQSRVSVAPSRSKVARVQPSRLSHILLFSRDVFRSTTFFAEALGLRMSDRSGDGIAFMHGAHGSDHHLIAVAKSSGSGLHHSSWDVASIDEVGAGMQQMLSAGYAQGWGVGRHVLGSNYFYYARDPWGSYCEYSFDIDYIPKGFRWTAADHPPEDSFYMWGPLVPEDFVTNYEPTRLLS